MTIAETFTCGMCETKCTGDPLVGVCDDCAVIMHLEAFPPYLATARRELADVNERIAESRRQWEEANADLLEEQRNLKLEVAELESRMREVAVDVYRRTGATRPTPGVTIKNYTVYSYSETDAFEWAKAHNLCLTLDKKAFEKQARVLAESSDKPTWLKVESEPRATISKDLDTALAAAPDGGAA